MVKCERCQRHCGAVQRCPRCDRQVGIKCGPPWCWRRDAPWCVDCMKKAATRSQQDDRPRGKEDDRERQKTPLRRHAKRGRDEHGGLPALRDRDGTTSRSRSRSSRDNSRGTPDSSRSDRRVESLPVPPPIPPWVAHVPTGGDWHCDQCSTRNFARRTECFRCGIPRPEMGHAGVEEDKSKDWYCTQCYTRNFARRLYCFHCGDARPVQGAARQGWRTIEWVEGVSRQRGSTWWCHHCGAGWVRESGAH